MIKNIIKPISTHLRASFSSYQSKALDPFSNATYSFEPINKAQDAQRVFEQFFKENPPKQSQKSFLNLEKLQKKEVTSLDPYKILGIQESASKEKINMAFRELALKYHPKNDSSKQAGQKFVNIAWAYEMLNKKTVNKVQNQFSLMKNFNQSIKQFLNNEVGASTSSNANKTVNSNIKMAELYSQSKNIKKFGNQKQVSIEREYNRDGKLLKITRNQIYNQDGSVQVSQILDDGHDIKTIRLYKQNGSSQMRFINQSQD